jgi:hypothetical protein
MAKPTIAETPFDSIESAHEYVSLLAKQVDEVERGVAEDVASVPAGAGAARHLEALRLVDYKLNQLSQHLAASGRLLNDLRMLRRLLLDEREPDVRPGSDRGQTPNPRGLTPV